MTTPLLPTRPPRPNIPAPELLARAAAFGYSARELNDCWTTPDGDLVVSYGAGVECACVEPDRPDGAGQSGILLLRGAPGYPEPRSMRKFVPRRPEAPGPEWTIADLDWCSAKLTAPSAGEAVADGFGGFRSWLFAEQDAPVRAWCLWSAIAKRKGDGLTMTEALAWSEVARTCRALIIDSRWLSESEASTL